MNGYIKCPKCGRIIVAYDKMHPCCEYCDSCYDMDLKELERTNETEKLILYTRNMNKYLATRQVFL